MNDQWVGIVANANSGRGLGRARVERLIDALRARELEAQVAWTPDERLQMVETANEDPDCRCLVAVGGDGTVAALLNEKPRRPVTVLPAGTENLFAGHFQMRQGSRDVAETIARGRVAPIDLGLTANRRFALMAGIGFDADVVTRHHATRIERSGRVKPTSRVAYVEPVLRASFGYKFPTLRVTILDKGREEELVGTTAFIFNLPRYALGLPIAPTALGDDGLLDLVVFRNAGAIQALRYLWMIFLGLHLRQEGVYHRQVSRVSVVSTETVPVQLDGDPCGEVSAEGLSPPWTVEVLPNALEVMVPPRYCPPAAIA